MFVDQVNIADAPEEESKSSSDASNEQNVKSKVDDHHPVLKCPFHDEKLRGKTSISSREMCKEKPMKKSYQYEEEL
jgi:hypothetical protein